MNEKDGWYLFDGRQISGPFTIEALENVKTTSYTPDTFLITRQGYEQWYPISHLDNWGQPTDIGLLKRELDEFQREVERSANALAGLNPQKHSLQKIEPKRISVSTKPAPVSASAKRKVDRRTRAHPRKNAEAKTLARTASAVATQHVHQSSKVFNIDPAKSPAHNLMMLKGRLRLGDLRSPSLVAFAYTTLTLGVYPLLWFIYVYREIHWHSSNQIGRPSILSALGFALPVVACLPAYFLAREVARMEQQNHYRSIMPILALILGIFPPFALYYLQCAVNDHWILHVKNAQ